MVLAKILQNVGLFTGRYLDRVPAMRSIWRVISITGHLLLVATAVVAVQTATSHFAYPPLRHVMVVLTARLQARVETAPTAPFALNGIRPR